MHSGAREGQQCVFQPPPDIPALFCPSLSQGLTRPTPLSAFYGTISSPFANSMQFSGKSCWAWVFTIVWVCYRIFKILFSLSQFNCKVWSSCFQNIFLDLSKSLSEGGLVVARGRTNPHLLAPRTSLASEVGWRRKSPPLACVGNEKGEPRTEEPDAYCTSFHSVDASSVSVNMCSELPFHNPAACPAPSLLPPTLLSNNQTILTAMVAMLIVWKLSLRLHLGCNSVSSIPTIRSATVDFGHQH